MKASTVSILINQAIIMIGISTLDCRLGYTFIMIGVVGLFTCLLFLIEDFVNKKP